MPERLADLGERGMEPLVVGDHHHADGGAHPVAPVQRRRQRRDALPQAHDLAQVIPDEQDHRRRLGEQVMRGPSTTDPPAVGDHVSLRQLG